MLKKYIDAGNIHKEIRNYLNKYIFLNKSNTAIIKDIEELIKSFEELKSEKNNGIAFPIGLSINNCCAHDTYSPLLNNNKIIKDGDLIKIDYGIHIDGHIVDGAYSFNIGNKNIDKNNILMRASQDALINAIKNIGVDSILGDIGCIIQEVIESYEYEENNNIYKCKPISYLCGHNIDVYRIHAGKAVPNIKFNYNERVKDNEIYAIEPFVTFNNGETFLDNNNCTHFMLNKNNKNINNKLIKFYNILNNKYKTLPFCDKWINNELKEYNLNRKKINDCTFIESFPPIYTVNKEYVSQFEKTVYICNEKKMILN